jgi:hypothetical protein
VSSNSYNQGRLINRCGATGQLQESKWLAARHRVEGKRQNSF